LLSIEILGIDHFAVDEHLRANVAPSFAHELFALHFDPAAERVIRAAAPAAVFAFGRSSPPPNL
jgi:hypothetical protein